MVTKGRIRISKDKADLARSLRTAENPNAPFQTYADVLTFVAALGANRNRLTPLDSVSLKNPDPIPLDQFFTRGYSSFISLLALIGSRDPAILGAHETQEERRIQVFEEYANAGFEILQAELMGTVDYSEQILLLLSKERAKIDADEFDLTRFL